MNIPLLSYLVNLIEEILKKDVPLAGKAALASAESNPKVQAVTVASVALLKVTESLKEAVNGHPDAPKITPK